MIYIFLEAPHFLRLHLALFGTRSSGTTGSEVVTILYPCRFFLTQTRSEMCSFSEKSEAEDFLQLATPKKNGSKSVIDYSNPQTNRENLPVTSLKNLRKVTWMFPKIWLPQVTMAFNMFQY